MGRKKSFTTSALASLTGEAQAKESVAKETVAKAKETPVVSEPVVEEKIPVKAEVVEPKPVAKTTPAKKSSRATKKKKDKGLQDPNKRSVKKSHTPVTLYLNATNLEKLKEYAEREEQKISWLIDEMIFDYLSEVIE